MLGGLRYTRYQQNNYDGSGAISSSYNRNGVVTPTVALMFKPLPSTTPTAATSSRSNKVARLPHHTSTPARCWDR